MTMFNEQCTVINHYIDAADIDQYQETTLNGVCWQKSSGIQAEAGGYGSASTVLVVIPRSIAEADRYLPAEAFAVLPDKTGRWTLQEGDKLTCRGEEMTITAVSDHAYGAMAHWEVGGV